MVKKLIEPLYNIHVYWSGLKVTVRQRWPFIWGDR